MLKNQIEQYDMLLTVENHFEENSTLWIENEPMTAAKTALSEKIDEIEGAITIQLTNTTGITANKANLRTDLESKGLLLSAAMSAYAAVTPGKSGLYKNVHYTKTDLAKFREAELLIKIGILHRDAVTELTNLTPFGVTNASLTALATAQDAFGSIVEKPTYAIDKRKAATEKISILFRDATIMLETRMDNLVLAFSASEPEFASVYANVRSINNRATRTLSLTVTTLDARNNKPVANANLSIVGEGITRVSSKRGYNTVKNLAAGDHQLTISHPNFVTQTIPFTIVNGETTELVVTMESVAQQVPV